MTKLTSSQLEEIYGHLVTGKTVAEIATMYKVSKSRIYQLRTKIPDHMKNRIIIHVQEPPEDEWEYERQFWDDF